MGNYIYVPGLSESVETEVKEENRKKHKEAEKIVTTTGAIKKKITCSDRGVMRNKKVDDREIQIPSWQKYALTMKEAAEYYNIADSKLREFIQNNREEPFVLKAGGRLLVKRRLFEMYLDQNNSI